MRTNIGIKKIDKLLLKIGRCIFENNLKCDIKGFLDELLILLKKEGRRLELQEVVNRSEKASQLLSQNTIKNIDSVKCFYSEILDHLVQAYLIIIDYQIANNDRLLIPLVPKVRAC